MGSRSWGLELRTSASITRTTVLMCRRRGQSQMTQSCSGRCVCVGVSFLLNKSEWFLPPPSPLYQQTGVELMKLNSTDGLKIRIVPHSARFTLDYILLVPVKPSGYGGQTLMSDDHDETIKYSTGQWSSTESVVLPKAIPMKGTLNRATSVGASWSVEFTGMLPQSFC